MGGRSNMKFRVNTTKHPTKPDTWLISLGKAEPREFGEQPVIKVLKVWESPTKEIPDHIQLEINKIKAENND